MKDFIESLMPLAAQGKQRRPPGAMSPFARAMKQYAKRDAALRRMGFASYHDYLDSVTWARIRREVLDRHPRCEFCGGVAEEVHHSRYTVRNLTGRSLKKLHAVCRLCHREGEFTDSGQKLSPSAATRRMRAIRDQRRWRAPAELNLRT